MLSQLRDLYGLKYNPFSPDVPLDALLEGGFGMISGAPGLGKSVAARLTASRIGGLRDALCVWGRRFTPKCSPSSR